MKNSYMHSDRVKQMEDIGVKVALGVLCNILIVSVFSWSIEDLGARQTLSMLDAQGAYTTNSSLFLPEMMQDSVLLWSTSLDLHSIQGSLIFLDVAQRSLAKIVFIPMDWSLGAAMPILCPAFEIRGRTVCNELDQSNSAVSCTMAHDPWLWPQRGSLTAVDEAFQKSSHRQSESLAASLSWCMMDMHIF
eukprot:s521_g33.t1